jgi:hypothetical protein
MRNVIIKKAMTLELTADDWELYTSTRECNLVAAILNTKIADLINASTNRDVAYNEGCKVLEEYSEFGAGDTEPRYVLRNILAEFFGD